ncbi:hypothetical protein [Nocardioides sp. KR10-350]|uniref:hypothetical protein n=1 Tax=Nocardioides cheoyonin TaxID=3156615 RepID=UPI0032B36DB9
MTPQNIDQATKSRIHDALLAHLRAGMEALDSTAGFEQRTGELGQEGATLEPDDISQSDEADDLQGLFDDSATRQSRLLADAERLDFSLTDVVGPGAVVGLDDRRYVVGVASSPFESDGAVYEGISLDSPIYPRLQGRRAGEIASYAGVDHRIDFVA